MDRVMLEQRLALAERHVEEGKQHVEAQCALVRELEGDGHDTTEALRLLGQFEEMLAMHRSDRDRILGELGR